MVQAWVIQENGKREPVSVTPLDQHGDLTYVELEDGRAICLAPHEFTEGELQ